MWHIPPKTQMFKEIRTTTNNTLNIQKMKEKNLTYFPQWRSPSYAPLTDVIDTFSINTALLFFYRYKLWQKNKLLSLQNEFI